MKNKMVAIGLFPDRLDLLVVQGGRVIASRRLPVTFETTADGWSLSLRKAGPALSDAVRDLKLTGWSAAVLYANPTATAEYVSVNASSSTEAVEAAVLTISESLGYPLALAVTSAALISTDPRINRIPGADRAQSHLVATADRDDHAASLADLVQNAGLKLWSATPIDAAIMMKVATAALLSKVQRSAHLYVGEQRSFFVVVENGALVFARPIGLGIHTLATSLTRSMRTPAPGGPPGATPGATLGATPAPGANAAPGAIELDPHSARTVLQRFGFPDRSTVIDQALGLTGAQIIPLLQPVLQRFVVELRQSLRFGVSEEHRQSMAISFTGPGSSIPGFAGVVATELRLAVEVDQRYAGLEGIKGSRDQGIEGAGADEQNSMRPDAGGLDPLRPCELMDAIGDQGVLSRLNLQPRELAHARQINRLQRWVWTGAAMALALVGFDAMNCQTRLRSLEMQAQTEAARSTESQSIAVATQKMLAGIEAMTSLDNTIASQVGAQVNFRACMQEIASLVPATIRLTEIRFNQNDNKTTGSVLGYAFPVDHAGGERKSDLETFISRLTESPLFDKVALGNVQMASVSSRSAQQFEVGVTGVAVPMAGEVKSPVAGIAPVSAQAQAQEGMPR